MVLVVAASVLFPKGITVNSVTELGAVLEPAFGTYAKGIFMLGLFAASFSSLIGNATLGGVLLADALNIGRQLSSLSVRFIIMLVIVIGAAVAFIFGRLPINLIITAQAMTIIIVPLIGWMIYLIAVDKVKRNEMKMGIGLQLLMLIGLLLLIVLAAMNIYRIFLK